LMGMDSFGRVIWPEKYITEGLFTFSPDKRYIINFGFEFLEFNDPSQIPSNSGALINAETGALRVLWNEEEGNSYDSDAPPQISPDARYISFNTWIDGVSKLRVIDLKGKPLFVLDDALLLAWNLEGEFVVRNQVSEPEHGLDFYQLSKKEPVNILPAAKVMIGEADWSQDGKRLAFSTYDQAAEIGKVYIWLRDKNELIEVADHQSSGLPSDIVWMKDDQGFYYNTGPGSYGYSHAWQYQEATNSVRLIAEAYS